MGDAETADVIPLFGPGRRGRRIPPVAWRIALALAIASPAGLPPEVVAEAGEGSVLGYLERQVLGGARPGRGSRRDA